MFAEQLVLGTGMVLVTVIAHVLGLVGLAAAVQHLARKILHKPFIFRTVTLISFAVVGILFFHTVQAWTWAAVYMLIGEFDSLERALYFSAVTATTLGYGDLTLSPRWQLLSTFEAMGGLLLFGASTAFLIALMQRLFQSGELDRA